jgi:hypothetical protein
MNQNNPATKDELEYWKLMYNFEDTVRFFNTGILSKKMCIVNIKQFLNEAKIIIQRKTNTNIKDFDNFVQQAETWINKN